LDFVNVNQKNFDEKVNNLLQHIGWFFQVDRAYVFLFNNDEGTMSYTHEWCRDGIKPEIGTIKNVPLSVFPWWMGKLKNNELVYLEDVNELPDEAEEEKKQLTRQSVKSLISIPIEGNEYIQGFLGIDSVLSVRKWSGNHIRLLKILSNLLADGLLKIKAEKDIEYMAYYDYLTGLPNRSLFMDRLKQTVHMAQRTGKLVGVIFIDLDSFKIVNDTIGHSGGDLLIQQVAQGLVRRLRKMDTVARFSGDEFLVMVSNISKCKDIVTIADNIVKLFEKPFTVSGQEFFVTVSAGVAVYPVDGEDAGTLIKNAELAMYKAKSRGKNQYVLCTDDMKDEMQKNMILSNNLYRALERNELVVYYQPQINLYTGEISGFEALLRWKHPQMGMVSPGVFIPLAERNGLINSIGEWVLRTACIQNKKWQDAGVAHVRMSVNLSVVQFSNPRLIEIVGGILEETGLNPSFLELEITENIAIKEVNDTADILHKLKKLGVSVSIDDFGTEYSSLSRLKTLPVDRIKIDMQFVKGIESDEKDQAITKVIINLAKSLGLSVLAEGVETDLQKDFLSRNLCDDVQGYYYYKPMPAEDIEAILKASGKEKAE